MPLNPWVEGPFELITEAEIHRLAGGDADRRIALISFDNAIEVCVAAYLEFHPMLRGNRTYERADVDKYGKNFHTKIEFLLSEAGRRGVECPCSLELLVYLHDLRSVQYHGGRPVSPYGRDVEHARTAALWTFSMLFEIDQASVEAELTERVLLMANRAPEIDYQLKEQMDAVIDATLPEIEIGGYIYKASEVLFATDREAYQDLAISLGSPIPISGRRLNQARADGGSQRSAG